MTDLRNMSVDGVRKLINYDPSTGICTWKVARGNNKIKAGTKLATKDSWGYFHTNIYKREYKVHRLAWFHYYGEWPKGEIDHINGIKTDNRICNLRIVTRSQNEFNKPLRSDNKTGFIGVSEFRGKYQSKIGINGKLLHLGTFACPIKASEAYQEAKAKLHRIIL